MRNWFGRTFFRQVFGKSGRTVRTAPAARPRKRVCLGLEMLETRTQPAILPMAPWAQGLLVVNFTDAAQDQSALDVTFQPLAVKITSPTASATLTSGNTTITGTATSADISTITLSESTDSGKAVNVPLDAAGNFSFPEANLASGSHTVSLVATDLAGRSASTSVTVTVNVTGPTITSFDLGASSDSGVVGDHITNMATVTLIGVTEANATVVLGSPNQTVTANSSGAFTFTGITLSAGANTFSITATDSAGRTATDSQTITLDNTAPTLVASLSDDNGSSSTDSVTTDPAVAGTVTDSASSITSLLVGLDNGGTFPLTITSQISSGSFAITGTQVKSLASGGTLTAGAHTLNIQATDAAGNVTTQNVPFTFATPPATPTFDLDAASDTGTVGDHETLLANVNLVGVTTPNATVALTDTAHDNLGSVTADASGNFTFTAIPVATGSNAFTATATISGGFTATFSQTIVRDTTAPTLTAGLADDTGASSTDGITSNVTITGTAVDGANAVISFVGSADSDTSLSTNLISDIGAGNTFTLSPTVIAGLLGGTISQGTHTIHLRDENAAGDTTNLDVTFTFDSSIAVPTIVLDPASDTGTLGDDVTNLATVSFDVTTEANAAVVLKNGSGNTLATGTADGSGIFQFTNVALAAGTNPFTVVATDPAGNTATSTTLTITSDSTAPTLTAALSADTGTSSTDGITNNSAVTGTALDGGVAPAFLKASLDGDTAFDTDVTSALQANGSFTISAALMNTLAGGTLSQGAHTLHLEAVDAAGNMTTTNVTFTFDSILATPTLTLAADSDTGTTGDNDTSLSAVNLTGTADPGVTVKLEDGSSNVLATTTADSGGGFTFSNVAIALGSNTFNVVASDVAGNTATFTQTITRDNDAPVLTAGLSDDTGASASDGITSDPTITGSATPSTNTTNTITTLALALDNGSFIDSTVLLNGDGTFTISASTLATLAGVSTLPDGAHTLHIDVLDSGNNEAKLDVSFTLLSSTATPTVTLDPVSDTGTLGDDRSSLPAITLDGTASPGAGVTLLDGSNDVLMTTTADSSGKFTFSSVVVALGDNTFNVDVLDAAGNQGSTSIVITRADGPALTAALTNDTGASSTDGITSDMTIAGTVSPPAATTLTSITGKLDGGTPIDLSSFVSGSAFTITAAELGSPADGTHALVITATDNLGDATTVTINFDLVSSTPTPTFDLDPSFDDGTFGDHQTSIPTVTLDGTGEAGAVVILTDSNNNTLGTATISTAGSFVFDGIALAIGDNNFTATVTDAAGNTASFSQDIIRYTVTPTVTAALTNDTGTSNTDGVTTDDDITGTLAEPNGFISTFTVQLDGGTAFDGSPIVASDGSFDLTPADLEQLAGGTLAPGAHTVVFTATGSAGTVVTATVSFTLDVVANPTLTLDPTTGFGPAINSTTDQSAVNLLGTATPNTSITLTDSNHNILGTTTSDSSGNFSFTGIAVVAGDNDFTVSTPADGSGNVGSATVDVHRNSPPTVMNAIANQSLTSTPTSIDLTSVFTDPDINDDTLVQFNTNQGNFDVELFGKTAPQTVANFLDYVNDGFYDGTFFHRLAVDPAGNPFVLQGGGFTLLNSVFGDVTQLPPVANEFDFSNTAGTLAMAKSPNDPNSATSQFFFNLEDNGSNLDNQNGGFTVFGVLATPADAQTIINLGKTPTFNATFGNPDSPFTDLPLVNYTGNGSQFPNDAIASNSFIVVNNITVLKQQENLTYSIVSNSNPALATVSLNPNANERLTVALNAGQTGSSTIVIRATDLAGDSVTDTFTVSA
jgi:cyclophilin family peptidyl-prolyl cis-trans isomerase